MVPIQPVAAITWKADAVDVAWARLAADANAHDAAAFARDRQSVVAQSDAVLRRWGARPREAFRGEGYAVVTYDGPTEVRGERGRSAYFAVVTPAGEFAAPTVWEVTPGFLPIGAGALWNLRVSGCTLTTGDPVSGYPEQWRTEGIETPPSYGRFRASLADLLRPGGEPRHATYTATAHTPGTTCLYVGDLSTEHLRSAPVTPPAR